MDNICYNCFHRRIDGHGICTECGFDQKENREKYPMALPIGSILYGQYIVGRVLGQGGFGITYLAQDFHTKELVAIKEFFPDVMATRTNSITVTPFTGERGENFTFGKNSFLDEAKTMAEFNGNPNIVEVYSYFEENGTGYFVMEYVDGCSLQEYIKDQGGRLSWDETVKLILPVLNALSAVHEKGIIHRDVTPDNIYITKNGVVKLLDFGAARYSLGNVSRSLDVVLKHGFAPKEQYKRHGRQGPYTDIYSVGATIYYALTSVRPDDSIERSDEDTMPMPGTLGARIARWQEKIILKAMAINPEDRYQSATEFETALLHRTVPRKEYIKTTKKPQIKTENKSRKWLIPAVAAVAVGIIVSVGIWVDTKTEKQQIIAVNMGIHESDKKPQEILEMISAAEVLSPQESPNVSIIPKETYALKKLDYDVDAEPNEQILWGQQKYTRDKVETICFQSTLENLPLGAFDVSEAQDGTILAWMDGGNLTIASNGRIALPLDCSFLFADFTNLRTIDFGKHVDTSDVIDMGCMFSDCKNITNLDLSGFVTSSVTDMTGMFGGCEKIISLDLSGFNTANVTNMYGMFSFCKSLTNLYLSGFDTSKVTDMGIMFSNCDSLTSLDLTGFDTSKVTSMNFMFEGCKSLKDLDLSGLNTSKVTDMAYMFGNNTKLTSLDLTDFNTSKVTTMAGMFSGCSKLTNLDLSSFDASNVRNLDFMFFRCFPNDTTGEVLKCTDWKIRNAFNNR